MFEAVSSPYLVPFNGDFDPGFFPTDAPDDTKGKKKLRKELAGLTERLTELQRVFYAHNRFSLLLVFQAMDAAGKDGTIRAVMSGVNPAGCQVHSFKQPSKEELDHDFLWRSATRLPERGRIGIFNRSYYEEVLVVRVHEELLAKQRLPSHLVTGKIWTERCQDIVAVERYLARHGYLILKFFLNLSHGEQKERFLARLDNPDKHWKFSTADARERGFWPAYMKAYEKMIRRTATPHAPWYVVPADKKWFSRLVVAAAVVEAIERLDLRYPVVGEERRQELKEARRLLVEEDDP